MSSANSVRYVALGVLVAFATEASAQDARLHEVQQIWDAQRQEVATAYIRCRTFRTGSVNPLAHDDVTKAIRSVDLPHNPDQLKTVVDRLSSRYLSNPKPWGVIEYYYSGAKVKEVYADGGQVFVFDGQMNILHVPVNHQVTLTKPGEVHQYIRGLDDFRSVPDSGSYQVEGVASGVMTLRRSFPADNAAQRLFVEVGTGLIRETRLELSSGEIARSIIQDHFTTYSGGVTFPALVVRAGYGRNGLKDIDLTLIEEARFNEELAADTFRVAVPNGTNVFDQRESRIRTLVQASATNDVAALANGSTGQGGALVGGWARRNKWLVTGIAVTVGLLIVYVAILRKRNGPQRSGPPVAGSD